MNYFKTTVAYVLGYISFTVAAIVLGGGGVGVLKGLTTEITVVREIFHTETNTSLAIFAYSIIPRSHTAIFHVSLEHENSFPNKKRGYIRNICCFDIKMLIK